MVPLSLPHAQAKLSAGPVTLRLPSLVIHLASALCTIFSQNDYKHVHLTSNNVQLKCKSFAAYTDAIPVMINISGNNKSINE